MTSAELLAARERAEFDLDHPDSAIRSRARETLRLLEHVEELQGKYYLLATLTRGLVKASDTVIDSARALQDAGAGQ